MPLRDWIPEPSIILCGCQPWPPTPHGAGCPVCSQGIHDGDNTTYCAVCDSLSPQQEARVRAARIGLETETRAEAADRRAREKLRKAPRLTERERRHLWNGYRGGILAELAGELTNLAREGRDFLTRCNQEPDWSLILDKSGRVVGRLEPEPALA